jgi:hypothetical protein
MADVYENAILNIAATAFAPADSGIFMSKRAWHVRPLKVAVGFESGSRSFTGTYDLIHAEAWSTRVDGAPLNRRGWVLQERFFSPRILHFGKDQLLWECQESRASETAPAFRQWLDMPMRVNAQYSYRELDAIAAELHYHRMVRRHLELCPSGSCTKCEDHKGFPAEAYDQKISILYASRDRIVEVYTKARLTFRDDKLMAIAGIALRFEGFFETKAIYGLWSPRLISDLLWYCPRAENSSTLTRPTLKVHIPSWSWACLDRHVKCYDKSLSGEWDRSSRIVNYHHTAARIRIRPLLIKVSIRESNISSSHIIPLGSYKSLSVDLHLDAHASDVPMLPRVAVDRDNDDPDRRYAYLLCLETERPAAGLMLRRESARELYSRIGMSRTREDLRPFYAKLPKDDFELSPKDDDRQPGYHTITLV